MAGAVFGDHCSPISDTTILSSTGAHCNHIDHVTSQFPYALTVAASAASGYLVLGMTGSAPLGFVVTGIVMVVLILILKDKKKATASIQNQYSDGLRIFLHSQASEHNDYPIYTLFRTKQ